MSSNQSLNTRRRQRGITLYSMLAALAVVSILLAIMVTAFSGSNSKAKVLYSMMQSVGQASNRFQLDTSCFPLAASHLFQKPTTASNSCGFSVATTWQGPYMKSQPVSGTAITVPKIGANTTLSLSSGTYLSNAGSGTQYAVVASNVPTPIAVKAAKACGDNGATSSGSGSNNSSSCILGKSTGGVSTLTYVYSQGEG